MSPTLLRGLVYGSPKGSVASRAPRWTRPAGGVLAATAAALLALPTGLAALSVLVLLGLIARRLPGETAARKLAITVPVLLGMNAAVLTALAVSGLRADARWVVGAYLLMLVVAEGRRPTAAPPVPFADRTDGWALTTGVVVFCLLFRPFAGASVERLSALLSRSTDGGAHVSLIRAVLRQGGYLGMLSTDSGTTPGLSKYPSGWHGSVAGLAQLLGFDDDLHGLLMVIAAAVIGLCGLIAYLAVATALDVAHAVTGGVSWAAGAAAAVCMLLTTTAGATALLPASSSFAQIAGTSVLLAGTLAAVTATPGDSRTTAVFAVLAVGLFHTWFLLAPLLAAVMLVHLTAYRPSQLNMLGWGLPAVAFASYPILYGPDPAAQVVAAGSTYVLSDIALMALIVITLISAAALLVGSSGGRTSRLVVSSALVTSVLLTAAVFAVQIAEGGGTYYTLKLLYTTFTLSAVAAGAVLATAFSDRAPGRGHLAPAALGAVVLGGMVLASTGVRAVVVDQLAGSGTGLPDERVFAAVLDRHGSERSRGIDVWVVGACNRLDDRKAAQFVNSVHLIWDSRLLEAFEAFLNADADDLSMIAERARDPEVEGVQVFVHGNCPPRELAGLSTLPGVEVIEI